MNTTSTELQAILGHYKSVFREPKTLPPMSNHEHRIIMQQGTNPISVRPYRYPHFQKNEIEKIVDELLELGFVTPSNARFPHLYCWLRKLMGVGDSVLITKP